MVETITVPGRPETREKPPEPPGMWTCVLHNDDFTPLEFVVFTVTRVFGQPGAAALDVALQAHERGRAAVGAFTREVAETKAEEAMSLARRHDHPLLVTAEPTAPPAA